MKNVEWNGRLFSDDATPESLAAAGVPQGVIDDYVLRDRRAAVSAECRRRIYAVATQEAQMNMAAAVAVISGKTASARTDAEKGILAGAELAIGWVSAMRAAVGTLADNAEADFMSDAAWPGVPPEAMAMIEHF